MADRRALIVGGTGQIGHAAVDALNASGFRVAVTHRGLRDPGGLDAEILVLDSADDRALRAVARGSDLVVDTTCFTASDAQGLIPLAGEVGSLVVISTGSVYLGDNGTYFDIGRDESTYPVFPVPVTEEQPTIPPGVDGYGGGKADLERALLAREDLPVSILRPAAIHGPYSPRLREWYFIKRALDGRRHIILSRNGESRFSTTSTLNLAALILACAQTPGRRILNAVDEEGLSTRQIAEVVYRLLDVSLEVHGLPGGPDGELGRTPLDAPHDFVCSMDRAKHEVGYQQAVSYAEAVAADIEWVTSAVAEAEAAGGNWGDVFPSIVARSGLEGWFPYQVEDRWIESLHA